MSLSNPIPVLSLLKKLPSHFLKWLLQYGRNICDAIYPPFCVLCDKPLKNSHNWFCRECYEALQDNYDGRHACPRCAMNKQKSICTCDNSWEYSFERIFSFFDFDEIVLKIIHQIKYRDKSRLAYFLGKEFAFLIPHTLYDSGDIIIPVPLHFWRKLNRGFNQAEYFAQGIYHSRQNSQLYYYKNMLKRVKNTKTQTKLVKEQRQKNLANAFRVNPNYQEIIKGKRVILIDDVVTTGATTDSCTSTLLAAGATSVSIISLARA